MAEHDVYKSPLVSRYASREMSALFGARHRILTWRRIWLALAEGQARLGIKIAPKQIEQLRETIENIDFEAAARHEKRLRHDVMAHVHAWGEVAPEARGILHLGATSADIVDNADLIIMRDALRLVAGWIANVIDALGVYADAQKSRPTLGFTHYQPAQVTTVGKRASLWCYEFVRDLKEVEYRLSTLKFRGIKGATGTQVSFLDLFGGDAKKVLALEADVAKGFGFDEVEPVTGQTYTRKIDAEVVATLGGIAASAHKFANDMRLLSNLREIEEPFEAEQVGSSSMPHKRNPMRCERATGLARFVISLAGSPLQTAAEQWFERTLDDSSNKRIVIPEAFLATEACLRIVTNVAGGLVVHPKVIESRLRAELPYMATESILAAAVSAGGDRQDVHERIRQHAHAAAQRMKEEGAENDLLDRLRKDDAFKGIDFGALLDPSRFVGLAPRQVDAFLAEHVEPVRRRYKKDLGRTGELDV